MRGWVQRSGACVIVAVIVLATACGPSGPVGETVTSTPGPAKNATAPEPTSTGGTAPTSLRLATEPPEAIGDGVRVLVAGEVCRNNNDGVVRLRGGVAGSYPPLCGGGVVVDGLDVESVPGVEYFPPSEPVDAAEVTWAVVTLLGTWDGKRLQFEELNPPAPPEFTRLGVDGWCAGGSCAPLEHEPTTCPDAPPVPEDTTEQPGFDVLDAFDAYQQARPDVSASRWLHQGRVWMAFTDDPGTHIDQLCAIDPTVAIVRVPHSQRELQDLQAQLLGFADAAALSDPTAEPTGDAVSDFQGSGVDAKNGRVTVTITFAGQARVDELLQRYGADRLSVHSWMVPVATSQ